MNKKLFTYLDKLFTKSEDPKMLFALEKLFIFGIPFNKPHGIKFKKLSQFESRLFLPNKRINHNHLGGIHACAIATLGEFTAGLLLCKNYPTARFRIIMKDLHVEFYKQGRTDVYGQANISESQLGSITQNIAKEDKAEIKLETKIFDSNQEQLATVTTSWQLKDWNKSKMK
jgi:acyl-coenzyme A thioesterase PaaI-like protein